MAKTVKIVILAALVAEVDEKDAVMYLGEENEGDAFEALMAAHQYNPDAGPFQVVRVQDGEKEHVVSIALDKPLNWTSEKGSEDAGTEPQP
jgi:hypothetical protein